VQLGTEPDQNPSRLANEEFGTVISKMTNYYSVELTQDCKFGTQNQDEQVN
jgi:hypothetical protein